MKDWIENRRVLAAFGDPAGAKAVLAFLALNRNSARAITAVSSRAYPFYSDYGIPVRQFSEKSAAEWLENADVLLTGTSVPVQIELELIEIASKHGLPSLSIVDHWTSIAARFEKAGRRIYPDVVGVVDDRARRLAEGEGLPPGRIAVVGNPQHEFLQAWTPAVSRAAVAESLGTDPAIPYFVYAPEPFSRFGLRAKYGFDEADGLAMIRAAMAELGDRSFAVVIKPHANQDHAVFDAALGVQPKKQLIYSAGGDLATLCWYSAGVIGFFSNALLEAKVLGRPVFRPLGALKSGVPDPLVDFEGPGFSTFRDLSALAQALDQAICRNLAELNLA